MSTRASGRAGARKALILSPSASHPQDYGNRNRVFQTTSWLKNLGFEIHFLLYPYESDWVHGMPESAADMRAAWDSFAVIPPSIPLHAPPKGAHHEIDEWWDPQIGHHLEWLFAREAFDVFLVNYTFFSKAFEFAPKGTIRILETHDIFSGRKELFRAHGAEPEFFYTTPDREKIALDRADIVVAIKDAEAEELRALTSREVVSVPFDVLERPVVRRPQRLNAAEALKVGFIGALNTVNVLNMQRFLTRFARFERIYVPPPIEFLIAGNVCTKLKPMGPYVKLLGHVPSVDGYYGEIDVVVAPMAFSTGMKIKVGEALSFGKAVVSTANGFDGFPSADEFHSLDGVDLVCRAIVKLAFDRERLALLESRSAFAASLARRRSAAGYEALARAIGRLSKAVVFITDKAIWKSETLLEERLAQWAELCAHMMRVAIVHVGEEPVASIARGTRQLARNAIILDARDYPGGAKAALDDVMKTYTPVDIVISASGEKGASLCKSLRATSDCLTLDAWATESVADGRGDVWLSGAKRTLSTTAFRYLPESLRHWSDAKASGEIVAVVAGADDADMRGLDVLETILGSDTLTKMPEGDTDVLRALAGKDRPAMMLVIGSNTHIAEACRSLSTCAGVPFLHLSSARFPLALATREGGVELCASYWDAGLRIASFADTGVPGETEHPRDTGWSAYWRHLAQR